MADTRAASVAVLYSPMRVLPVSTAVVLSGAVGAGVLASGLGVLFLQAGAASSARQRPRPGRREKRDSDKRKRN